MSNCAAAVCYSLTTPTVEKGSTNGRKKGLRFAQLYAIVATEGQEQQNISHLLFF